MTSIIMSSVAIMVILTFNTVASLSRGTAFFKQPVGMMSENKC